MPKRAKQRREIKHGLSQLWEGVTREPVPDDMARLLARLDTDPPSPGK